MNHAIKAIAHEIKIRRVAYFYSAAERRSRGALWPTFAPALIVHQDAREVKTKFSKTFDTHFFPVGEEARAIVEAWASYLKNEKMWGNDDPLFPATEIKLDSDQQFAVTGLARKNWSSASTIRKIFREAFHRAGLPYFNPHSFRNTLVKLGQEVCQSAEEFKAWSQNLGHENVLTTFLSYGTVEGSRQGEIIRKLGQPRDAGEPDPIVIGQEIARYLIQTGAVRPNQEA
jgi:hypothetical protein